MKSPMSDTILFAYPGACSRVTMSALEESGVDYDLRWIDIASNGQYSAEYLATNRKSKVPALVVDGQTLTENAAILLYLHRQNPSAGLLPQLDGVFGEARGFSDLVWCGSMLHPMVRQIRAPQRWTQDSQETDGIRADGLKKLAKECDHIDAQLAKAEWWYGERWSIVDVYLYWVYSTAAKASFPVQDYPAINAHAERVRARRSFQRALEREVAAGLGIDPASL